jgi:hypothetical protein
VPRWVGSLILVVAAGGVAAAFLLLGGSDPPPPVGTLLRPGTQATLILREDLNGDGVDEVALAARARDAPEFGFPDQFLDVYRVEDGSWQRVLDGTGEAPGGGGGPGRMLDPPRRDFNSRLVDGVEAVDFANDGSKELVVSVLTAGAGEGPLEVWVLSLEGDTFRTQLYRRTTRGGELVAKDDRAILTFGVYRPSDPGCCPSTLVREVIGFDEEAERVKVLGRRTVGG